jgi:hypothetical protein
MAFITMAFSEKNQVIKQAYAAADTESSEAAMQTLLQEFPRARVQNSFRDMFTNSGNLWRLIQSFCL